MWLLWCTLGVVLAVDQEHGRRRARPARSRGSRRPPARPSPGGITMNPPPPMLPATGKVTASAKAVATAASTALPPSFSTSRTDLGRDRARGDHHAASSCEPAASWPAARSGMRSQQSEQGGRSACHALQRASPDADPLAQKMRTPFGRQCLPPPDHLVDRRSFSRASASRRGFAAGLACFRFTGLLQYFEHGEIPRPPCRFLAPDDII